MRALRRHIVVRVVASLLLTWAAADLLVPELCSSEATFEDDGSTSGAPEPDDCFCCCRHTEKALSVTVTFSEGRPVVDDALPADGLLAGLPRLVSHPPLLS